MNTSTTPILNLLDELEIIDKALLEGAATPGQERLRQEIVTLCNDAPRLKSEVDRLTGELDTSRNYCKFLERERRRKLALESAYKSIDAAFKAIKDDAERAAQDPFDEHYRECLYGLREILNEPDACSCKTIGLDAHHEERCPHAIALRATAKADEELEAGLRKRYPDHYEYEKRGKTKGPLMEREQGDMFADPASAPEQCPDGLSEEV